MHALDDSTICSSKIYHWPIYVWPNQFYTFKMPNKGMGREISIAKPWYKIIINPFLLQKIIEGDTIFYIYYFVANFTFGIFSLKVIRIRIFGGRYGYICAYWLQFQEFLEVMLLVKSKYA